MRTTLHSYSLRFHLSLPAGRYSGSAAIPKEEASRETLLLSQRIGRSFRTMPYRPSFLHPWAETKWDFTGQTHEPFSSGDIAKYQRQPGRIAVWFSPGVPQRQGTRASSKGRRLARQRGRHDTPRSRVVRPLRDGKSWLHPGYVPPDLKSGVLTTPSARVRTRTGRIRSLFPSISPFVTTDLAREPYGSRAPSRLDVSTGNTSFATETS